METDPASVVMISASGVVAIALANTGFVLLCTMFSKMFPPSRDDLVKMLKDDLAYLASQTRRYSCTRTPHRYRRRPGAANTCTRMHMHRLIALIRIEVKPPALHIENGRLQFAVSIIKRHSRGRAETFG